jgi:hypothetical protein
MSRGRKIFIKKFVHKLLICHDMSTLTDVLLYLNYSWPVRPSVLFMTGFESIIGHPGHMYDASHIQSQFQRFCSAVSPLTHDGQPSAPCTSRTTNCVCRHQYNSWFVAQIKRPPRYFSCSGLYKKLNKYHIPSLNICHSGHRPRLSVSHAALDFIVCLRTESFNTKRRCDLYHLQTAIAQPPLFTSFLFINALNIKRVSFI